MFFLGVQGGLDGLGEFPSEDQDFESVEVGEGLSKGLLFDGLAFSGVGEQLRDLLESRLDCLDVGVLGELLEFVLGGLESLD